MKKIISKKIFFFAAAAAIFAAQGQCFAANDYEIKYRMVEIGGGYNCFCGLERKSDGKTGGFNQYGKFIPKLNLAAMTQNELESFCGTQYCEGLVGQSNGYCMQDCTNGRPKVFPKLEDRVCYVQCNKFEKNTDAMEFMKGSIDLPNPLVRF